MKINLKQLRKGSKVHHIVFMIKIDDLKKNQDAYLNSRYRLTDFDVNFAFDSHSFGKEWNLTELRSGGDGGD